MFYFFRVASLFLLIFTVFVLNMGCTAYLDKKGWKAFTEKARADLLPHLGDFDEIFFSVEASSEAKIIKVRVASSFSGFEEDLFTVEKEEERKLVAYIIHLYIADNYKYYGDDTWVEVSFFVREEGAYGYYDRVIIYP